MKSCIRARHMLGLFARKSLFPFLLVGTHPLFAQELVIVRDTVHHFEIGVPAGWRYGVPKDKSVAFIAVRQKENDADVPHENFNVNAFRQEKTDLEETFQKFVESISGKTGFKILVQGNTTINGRTCKFLIETHINPVNSDNVHNYDIMINDEGALFILSMVTESSRFENWQPLFEKVAMSLKVKN